MLQTRCFGWSVFRKRPGPAAIRAAAESAMIAVFTSVLPPWNNSPRTAPKLDPLRERAASRYGEGAAFHLGDGLLFNGDALVGGK